MTKLYEIYKCEICGNMVEMVHEGEGEMTCCNQKMKKLEANTEDAVEEKHVPCQDGTVIQVGDVAHPMTQEHHIEWIEIINLNGETMRKYLKLKQPPEWDFCREGEVVRAYCNLHGLWQK